MRRVYRIDYLDVELVLDAAAVATPRRAVARRTPEGYLVADAYIARDGLLKYSDGQRSWMELRPRAELERSIATWVGKPVTDDHPPALVTSSTCTTVQRGVVLSPPVLEVVDGVAYMRTTLQITDRALVDAVIANKRRQVSIGFEALVDPQRGTFDGVAYEAVQTSLLGNHVAVVDRGRAGPAVRLLGLDSATCVAYSTENPMRTLDKLIAMGFRLDAVKTPKIDEVGNPTTMSKMVGPDGTEIEVPTWVAALVQEAIEARKAAGQPAEASVEGDPELDEADPAAAAAAVPPEDEKKKDPPPMTQDAIDALVKRATADAEARTARRFALVRKCDAAKIDSKTIEACTDEVALARLYVATVAPHLKAKADAATGPALDAFVDAAALHPIPVVANPWERPTLIKTDSERDPEVERYAAQLAAAGIRG